MANAIEKELMDATRLQRKRDETFQSWAKRLTGAVADLSQDDWDNLSKTAQGWANEATRAVNRKDDIANFPADNGEEPEPDDSYEETGEPEEGEPEEPEPEPDEPEPEEPEPEPDNGEPEGEPMESDAPRGRRRDPEFEEDRPRAREREPEPERARERHRERTREPEPERERPARREREPARTRAREPERRERAQPRERTREPEKRKAPAPSRSRAKEEDRPRGKPAQKRGAGDDKGPSATTLLKKMLIRNPNMTTEEVLEELKDKHGLEPSRLAIASIRSAFIHSLRMLKAAKLLDDKLAKKL